jgi:hypothetical protein
VNAHDIQIGSSAAMTSPRVTMNRSSARAGSPLARRFSTLRARAVPARKTNVGAQRWETQRVKNCAAGRGAPGVYMKAPSVMSRPALK